MGNQTGGSEAIEVHSRFPAATSLQHLANKCHVQSEFVLVSPVQTSRSVPLPAMRRIAMCDLYRLQQMPDKKLGKCFIVPEAELRRPEFSNFAVQVNKIACKLVFGDGTAGAAMQLPRPGWLFVPYPNGRAYQYARVLVFTCLEGHCL